MGLSLLRTAGVNAVLHYLFWVEVWILPQLFQLAWADPIPIPRASLFRVEAYSSSLTGYLERQASESTLQDDALSIIKAANNACAHFGYAHGAVGLSLEEIDWGWSSLHLGFKALSCSSKPEEIYDNKLRELTEQIQLTLLDATLQRLKSKKILENQGSCASELQGSGLVPGSVERIGGGSGAPLEPKLLREVLKGKIWVDLLPAPDYSLDRKCKEIALPLQKGCRRLAALMDQYHRLEKTDPDQTPGRQFLLGLISVLSSALSQELGSDPLFDLIAQTAAQKAKYLKGLWEAFGDGSLDLRSEANKRIFRFPSKIDGSTDPVPVRGFVNRYPGEWLKHIDPAGREHGSESSALFNEWKRAADLAESEGRTFPNYFYWLEGKSLGDLDFSLVSHKYYQNPEERKVTFGADGIAYSSRYSHSDAPHFIDPKMGDSDRRYHYMVDEKGDLYIHETGVHTGVNRGANAITAGLIEFRDGRIKYMDNDSGHYRPSRENLENGVRILRQKFGPAIFREDFKIKNHAPKKVDILKSGASQELVSLSLIQDQAGVELLEKIKVKRDYFDRTKGTVVSQAMTAKSLVARLKGASQADVTAYDQKLAAIVRTANEPLKWTRESEGFLAHHVLTSFWTLQGFDEVRRQVTLSLTKMRSYLEGENGPALSKEELLAAREIAYVLEKMDAAFLDFEGLLKRPNASLEEVSTKLKNLAAFLPSEGRQQDLPLFSAQSLKGKEFVALKHVEPLKELIGGYAPRVKLPFFDLLSIAEVGSSFNSLAKRSLERRLQLTPQGVSALRLIGGESKRELALDEVESHYRAAQKRVDALREEDPLKSLRGFEVSTEDLQKVRSLLSKARGARVVKIGED